MGLNARGYISIVQAIVYTPILILAAFLVHRHGTKKQQGWIYLATFSLTRIVGAILLIVEESESQPSSGLITAATIVQSIGLSPLILSTLGFVCTVGQGTGLFTERYPVSRVVHLVLTGGIVMGIIAGTDASKPGDAGTVSTLRKLSAIAFFVTYVFLVGLHVFFWLNRAVIRPGRKTLLLAISCAVPFLFMRFIYTLGSAFESSSTTTFNLISGSAAIFVIFSAIPEFLVVLTYIIGGIKIPLNKDDDIEYGSKFGSANSSAYGLQQQGASSPQPILQSTRPAAGHGVYAKAYNQFIGSSAPQYSQPPNYPPSSVRR